MVIAIKRDYFPQQHTWLFIEIEKEYVAWNLDASSSRLETPGKFWDVVLEKDVKDQLDRSCEKWRSIAESQGAEEYPTWNKETEG